MTILLTDNELSKNTLLSGNIDKDKLRQCILDAQSERLEVLLGEKLYEKICADYDADNLEDEYLILYTEYIKPFLIRQSALEYLKIGAFSVSNNGIFQPTSQNAQPISDAQLQVLKDEMSIKANAYADRMHRWLKQKNLPEYECDSENIINPTKPSVMPWYLP
jgi:hypothetical protein